MFERIEEPFQHQQGAFRRIPLLRRCHEQRGVFSPVCGELDQGLSREDEGRGSQGGEITVEGGNGLQTSVITHCYRLCWADLEERRPGPFTLARHRATLNFRHIDAAYYRLMERTEEKGPRLARIQRLRLRELQVGMRKCDDRQVF